MANADDADVSIIAPIVASHNSHMDEQTLAIRARVIPWEGYQRASLITEDELMQIRQYEKNPDKALAEAGERYVLLFLNLLQKLVRTDTIQNILVIIDDMLQKDSERASIFFKIAEQANDSNLPYAPFVKLLKKDDEYLQLKAAKIATFLLLEQTTPVKYDPSELFAWTINQMSAPNQNVVDIAVQLVQSLLSIVNYRPLFFQTQRGVSSLVDILKRGNPSAQMQYQVIYNFWLLSFDEDVAAEIQRKHDIVPVMIDIAKSAIKEKVVRVVISTFVNLLVKAPEENLMAMLAHKVLNLSETLSSRKWSDTEIADDLEFIKEKLQTNVANLSTFDEYSAEVRSGALSWSPPHISEQFWKQNASRLNDKDFELLRMLSRLLATSANPVVLAVAAHDIGQYVKYATNGKRHVQEIGAKTQIMELMAHENQDVRYQALLAVQKYMAHAWEY